MKCEDTGMGGRAKSGVVLFTTNPTRRHPGLRVELSGETPALTARPMARPPAYDEALCSSNVNRLEITDTDSLGYRHIDTILLF